MGSHPCAFLKQNALLFLSFLLILFLCSKPQEPCLYSHSQKASMNSTILSYKSSSNNPPLETLVLNGCFKFNNIEYAAKDFGNRFTYLPSAVLYPNSVSDIASTIKYISRSNITVAARGNGHSLQGQSQANQGIVIHMKSLKSPEMRIHTGEEEDGPYVDVSGGELWINILHETLKFGFAPKSWTDYLHLTIGGTLSNAGVSGQAFRHGPQIHNVFQLQVVTGNGDVVTCSEQQNSDLFHGVLGGLGQFGIITRARISLERAPKMVRWIRVLYSDFSKFSNDQEHLISSRDSFDYIEGFVNINRSDLLQSWRSSFTAKDPVQASQIVSDGKTLYCLEIAKYFNPGEYEMMNKKTEDLLSELSFIPSTVFQTEVPYLDFLERVHASEKKLREKGLWEVPHPWLNLLVPKAKIHQFSQEVFGNILTDNSNGPILIYPVNQSKWNNRTSLVTPEGDIFYLIAFLASAVPSSTGKNGLKHILNQNKRVLDFCTNANIGIKQYLPHYTTQQEWRAHFGVKWEVFAQRKSTYDPLAILAPGQRIFRRRQPSNDESS